MRALTHADKFLCPHGFPVKISAPGQRALKIDGKPVLLVEEIEKAVVQCSAPPPAGPCTGIKLVRNKKNPRTVVKGKTPALENVKVMTDRGKATLIPAPGKVAWRVSGNSSGDSSGGGRGGGSKETPDPPMPGSLEIIFAAFIDGQYGEWLAEPFTQVLHGLCRAGEDYGPSRAGLPPSDEGYCTTNEFRSDNRGFGDFDAKRKNARLWIRISVPTTPGKPLPLDRAEMKAFSGESHRREHFHYPLSRKTEEISKYAAVTEKPSKSAGEARISAFAAYPFIPAFDIDISVTLKSSGNWGSNVRLEIELQHDRFPSYELYINGEQLPVHDAMAEGQTGPGLNLVTLDSDSTAGKMFPFLQPLKKRIFVEIDPDGVSWKSVVDINAETLDAIRKVFSLTISLARTAWNDHTVRNQYVASLEANREFVLKMVKSGKWTAQRGMYEATRLRTLLRSLQRHLSSPVGKAWSLRLHRTFKLQPKMNAVANQLFRVDFSQLNEAQRSKVYLKIILSSGKPRPHLAAWTKGLSIGATALVVATFAFAIHEILESESPGKEAVRQGVVFSTGFFGGMAVRAASLAIVAPGAVPIILGFAGGMVLAYVGEKAITWLLYDDG